MKFSTLYRASMYLMLTLATTILGVEAGDYSPAAKFYPPVVAAASVLALLTVDRNPRLGLNRGAANVLGLASGLLALGEFSSDPDTMLLLALGHWLVYLQLVKMALPKTVEDDWFLFADGLVQVVIGVVLSGSGLVGGLLGCWAATALWTLGLFHLHREASGEAAGAGPSASITPRIDRENPYRGLLNFGFVASALLVAATTLALGALIFLLIPRSTGASDRRGRPPEPTTGFSPDVKLGDIGQILENQDVVMTVELFDGFDVKLRPRGELLWRGLALIVYRGGIWHRYRLAPMPIRSLPLEALPHGRRLRQKIKLERSTDGALFGIRPIYGVRARKDTDILFNRLDGTIVRDDLRGRDPDDPKLQHAGTFDYEVISADGPGFEQPEESVPSPKYWGPDYLQLPEELREGLAGVVEEALAFDGTRPTDPTGIARALESYLRDSGRFFYSLEKTRINRAIDPVLDFLENRREGHCEYYASALALMLRERSIPSRVINGFKGGDYNEVFGTVTIRERDAHSWVEALVRVDANDDPVWLTLDPTPAFSRPGEGETSPWSISETFRHIWLFYIDGFDPDRQARVIYEPLKALWDRAGAAARSAVEALADAGRWLFIYRRAGDFFSARGFAVSVVVMLALVGLGYGLRWLALKLWGRLRRGVVGDDGEASEVAFYHRLLRMLAAVGLDRPGSETPREFARRASALLPNGPTADPEGAPDLDEVPADVVEAYYRVHYGGHPLPVSAIRRLEARLDALEARLLPTRA